MGTPEFALPTLDLLAQHHQIVAVYTQGPKPAGRGMKLTPSPVHILADKLNIPVFTPKTLRNEHEQEIFTKLDADCAVVVSYGLILPSKILNAFPYGCINIHPSKLPKFRGAAPIQRTILAGMNETAVCIMKMDQGIDTGDVLKSFEFKLEKDVTSSALMSKCSLIGAELMLEVLANIDNIKPIKQPENGSCYAAKIDKKEGQLFWNNIVDFLDQQVRALNPWPGTFFYCGDEQIKVLDSEIIKEPHNLPIGALVEQKTIKIACTDGFFVPKLLKRPGRKVLEPKEFLLGYQNFYQVFNQALALNLSSQII